MKERVLVVQNPSPPFPQTKVQQDCGCFCQMCFQAQSVFQLRILDLNAPNYSVLGSIPGILSPMSGRTEWGSIKKPQTTGLLLAGTQPVFRTDFTFLHLGLLACAQGQLGLVRGPQLPSPAALCGSSVGGWWTGTGEAEPWPGWLCGVEDNEEDPPQDKILTRLYSHKSEDWLSYLTASEIDRHSMYHVFTTMVVVFFSFP